MRRIVLVGLLAASAWLGCGARPFAPSTRPSSSGETDVAGTARRAGIATGDKRSRIPPEASKLPCRRSATDTWYALDTPYRDCAPPNMTAAISAPWIDRPKQ